MRFAGPIRAATLSIYQWLQGDTFSYTMHGLLFYVLLVAFSLLLMA